MDFAPIKTSFCVQIKSYGQSKDNAEGKLTHFQCKQGSSQSGSVSYSAITYTSTQKEKSFIDTVQMYRVTQTDIVPQSTSGRG